MKTNLLENGKYRKHNGIYPFIVQIGAGGTGSYIIQNLSQMIGTLEIPHSYIIADPDIIEAKNLRNQLFLEDEIGLKKADVLAERYAEAYNLNVATYTDKYLESKEDILRLFSKEYLDPRCSSYDVLLTPILIGAVDNSYTRQILNEVFKTMPNIIYIDSGNESPTMPSDWQTRSMNQWSAEELATYNDSGWSGQVVCGMKFQNQSFYQPPLCEMYPDVLEDMDSIKPSGMSCSDLTASEPQRAIVNKTAALVVLNYLNDILEEKCVTSHITLFHTKQKYMRTFEYEPPTNEE